MKRIPVAVIGASGYSGEELLGILTNHPGVEVAWATSRAKHGRRLEDEMPRLAGSGLVFARPDLEKMPTEVEGVFLALPHGTAAEFAVPLVRAGRRVFDLSADFRLRRAALYRSVYGVEPPPRDVARKAVYGLPERYREQLRSAPLVAVPGCYPTGAILGALPALEAGLIRFDGAVISSMSGVSGAGRKAADPYLFCECNESVRAYGLLAHRHQPEIEQEMAAASGGRDGKIVFTPHLVPMNRGILTTAVYPLVDRVVRGRTVARLYAERYADEPFVLWRGGDVLPDTKHVAFTNRCEVTARVDRATGTLLVVSAIDNLVKGAAGQAVQCFNIAFGLDEAAGLRP